MAPGSWPHTAAVLAGGASTRMGRPKDRLPLADGRAMIDAVIAALAAVASRVVVVGGDGPYDVPRLDDRRPGLGPLAGLEALLASGLDDRYLACPCDVPRLGPGALAPLVAAPAGRPAVLHVAGELRWRPLPACLDAAALPAVRDALDRGARDPRALAVHRLLGGLDPRVVPVPAGVAALLANVNTPDDYAALTGRPRR